MAGDVRVGMSGFAYPSWVGAVYPSGTSPKRMLAAYATRFDAVELQANRRTAPSDAAVRAWRDGVPDGFRFAAKASRGVTHAQRRPLALEALSAFADAMRGLSDRLGPLFLPTAPAMRCDPRGLAAFLDGLPAGFAWAVEYRHESVWAPAVGKVLAARGVARVLNDETHDAARYAATASFAYLRLRRVDYSPVELRARRDLVGGLAAEGVDVYVFFRHTDDPSCTRPALAFRELVA